MLVFLKTSTVFLGICPAKCSRAIRDGEKGMAFAFLVLGMTWGQRAGALVRPGTPGAESVWEGRRRALEKCSGLCWKAHTQIQANRSAPVPAGPSLPKRLQAPNVLLQVEGGIYCHKTVAVKVFSI